MANERAKQLRRGQTEAERLLWHQLRARQFAGIKFRRQVPIGHYIVDFICFEKRLIVELDGGQHQDKTEYDAQRTNWLESQGFRVIRFWNGQVFTEMEAVEQVILDSLMEPSPSP